MAHFLISAAHKSSGKTTISLGLCAAFQNRGLIVRPFKKGPDYIDPMWLSSAAGHSCHNLDFNTMGKEELLSVFAHYSHGSDLSLIEGNKGLYDGLDLKGSNSNAALASLLKAPVILVIDARGMTRGIAPLILGYQAFEPDINIAGVILNQLGGSRHESKLRAVIDHYTNVPVVGAVHHDKELQIVERHLGLIPSNEDHQARSMIETIGKRVKEQVDLDRILEIAQQAPTVSAENLHVRTTKETTQFPYAIGIARDAAFGFYYPGDIEAFKKAGAEIRYFDTLRDSRLPEVDGIFIGGGFPETQMAGLEKNAAMRDAIKQAIEQGMPVYAECGGLMYLTRSIQWQGQKNIMVGAIPADTLMHDKPVGRGYVRLKETSHHPWKNFDLQQDQPVHQPDKTFAAHEFHYSSLENHQPFTFAYEVLRGTGIDGKHDGIIYKNVLGCYSHLRNVAGNQWVQRFLSFIQDTKSGTKPGQVNHS